MLLRGQKIDLAVKEAAAAVESGARPDRNQPRDGSRSTWNWASVYQRLGEWDKALEALRYGRSIKLHPSFFDEMSRVYRLKGDNRQAEITLMEGLVADPSVTLFASELVDLYTQSEPQSCAVRRAGGGDNARSQLSAGARPTLHRGAQHDHPLRPIRKAGPSGATARTAVEEMGCPAGLFQ